ncbi:hypothetical protein A9Q84_12780 [Halobacteriovorax marinus]|uniref:Uncharacterized protein n=1 Tax=Halobacteriovorax marinus TaxID=97084 RepID=A0A1Y5F8W0_9BACT|nr:hypothetical protein A9Q84_12780 [Halobacteriovorax marinus]
MSEQQAKPNQPNKSNQSRNRYRGKNKNKPFNKKAGSSSNTNRRKKNFKKSPRLPMEDMVTLKYNNLLEQHLLARKKYFALFHRADPNQKAKLERIYANTISKLREFERNLSGEKKDLFEKHFHSLKVDLEYSSNHEISPVAEHVSHQGDFKDPHYLEVQIESDYKEDTEESMGSIEDYKAYKGA